MSMSKILDVMFFDYFFFCKFQLPGFITKDALLHGVEVKVPLKINFLMDVGWAMKY
jgi:hypothetical protein